MWPLYTLPNPPSPNSRSGLKLSVTAANWRKVKTSAATFTFPNLSISSASFFLLDVAGTMKKIEVLIFPIKQLDRARSQFLILTITHKQKTKTKQSVLNLQLETHKPKEMEAEDFDSTII